MHHHFKCWGVGLLWSKNAFFIGELSTTDSFYFLGSLIIFVVLLSVGFLNRKVNSREWTGIIAIILGLFIVGLSDFYISKGRSFNSVITGKFSV